MKNCSRWTLHQGEMEARPLRLRTLLAVSRSIRCEIKGGAARQVCFRENLRRLRRSRKAKHGSPSHSPSSRGIRVGWNLMRFTRKRKRAINQEEGCCVMCGRRNSPHLIFDPVRSYAVVKVAQPIDTRQRASFQVEERLINQGGEGKKYLRRSARWSTQKGCQKSAEGRRTTRNESDHPASLRKGAGMRVSLSENMRGHKANKFKGETGVAPQKPRELKQTKMNRAEGSRVVSRFFRTNPKKKAHQNQAQPGERKTT